jgi:aminoglycoside N3'-acetyltransferase
VIKAFIQSGSRELLFPVFDFHSWSELGYFDTWNTTSKMGIISETARLHPIFRRTTHPMLGFAVCSSSPEYWLSDVANGHGAGSVFAKFIQRDGVLVSFSGKGFRDDDVGYTSSVHAFVEAGVDWRTMKVFEGIYVDGGVPTIRKYAASVTRDPSKHQTAVTPGHLDGERQGVIRRMKLGRTVAWVANAIEFHEFCKESCLKQPELWVRTL